MSTFLISYRVRRDSVDRQRLVENEFSAMCGDLLESICVVSAKRVHYLNTERASEREILHKCRMTK